jgi:hypothetical protein
MALSEGLRGCLSQRLEDIADYRCKKGMLTSGDGIGASTLDNSVSAGDT